MLNQYGRTQWANKIEDDLFFLNKGDLYGAERFLTYFGGMGSLSDIVFCEDNGDLISRSMESKVNEEFLRQTSNARHLAAEITNNAD